MEVLEKALPEVLSDEQKSKKASGIGWSIRGQTERKECWIRC